MAGVGHFRSEAARAYFLDAYCAGMAGLPASDACDVATSFGSVRVYRFEGPRDTTPVVLLPGRGAGTPMWRPNMANLMRGRTVFGVDLLGEAGLSVQTRPISGSEDQAQWLDEALDGLGLTSVHLLGASIGGWAAVNHAARRPGRAASLALLDPVQTVARIPVKTVLASVAMVGPGVPETMRKRVLGWIGGGQDVDDMGPEARVISSAMADFVLRLPPPRLIADAQLAALDIPVLAILAGRSVMLDSERASARARRLLRHRQIEVWADASHAINGEFPDRVAERTDAFWDSSRS